MAFEETYFLLRNISPNNFLISLSSQTIFSPSTIFSILSLPSACWWCLSRCRTIRFHPSISRFLQSTEHWIQGDWITVAVCRCSLLRIPGKRRSHPYPNSCIVLVLYLYCTSIALVLYLCCTCVALVLY